MAFFNNVPDKINFGQKLVNMRVQFQLQNRNILHMFPGEYLIFHALNSMNNDDDPIANCWLMTNMRFTKLEKAKSVTDVPLSNIVRCTHQKNGLFKWDKVEFHLKNGSMDTAGLANSIHCGWVVKQLNSMLAGQIPPYQPPMQQPPMQQPPMQQPPMQQPPMQQPPMQMPPMQQPPMQRPPMQRPQAGYGGVPALVPDTSVFVHVNATGQNLGVRGNGQLHGTAQRGERAKWVVVRGNQANTFKLRSVATGKFLRLTPNGSADAEGVPNGPNVEFMIVPNNQPPNVCIKHFRTGNLIGFDRQGQHVNPSVGLGTGFRTGFTFSYA